MQKYSFPVLVGGGVGCSCGEPSAHAVTGFSTAGASSLADASSLKVVQLLEVLLLVMQLQVDQL